MWTKVRKIAFMRKFFSRSPRLSEDDVCERYDFYDFYEDYSYLAVILEYEDDEDF